MESVPLLPPAPVNFLFRTKWRQGQRRLGHDELPLSHVPNLYLDTLAQNSKLVGDSVTVGVFMPFQGIKRLPISRGMFIQGKFAEWKVYPCNTYWFS
jgi:hypothetical protein